MVVTSSVPSTYHPKRFTWTKTWMHSWKSFVPTNASCFIACSANKEYVSIPLVVVVEEDVFFPCALHRAQMRKISRKTRTIVLTMSLRAWLFLSFETNETGTVLRCKVCWTHGSVGTCRWTQGVRVEERIFRMDSERSSRSLREHGRFMNGKRSRMHRRCTCKTFVLVRDERKDG